MRRLNLGALDAHEPRPRLLKPGRTSDEAQNGGMRVQSLDGNDVNALSHWLFERVLHLLFGAALPCHVAGSSIQALHGNSGNNSRPRRGKCPHKHCLSSLGNHVSGLEAESEHEVAHVVR